MVGMMSAYNREQVETFAMVQQYLKELSPRRLGWLKRRIRSYLEFRADVARFQKQHFAGLCTRKCFTSRMSACCGREGIVVFFADVVIEVLISAEAEIDRFFDVLRRDRGGVKCVYLTERGCLWRVKPIVCEMFLCAHARTAVLEKNEVLRVQWERLRQRNRRYTWPTRPVLFDELEAFFVEAGLDSPLMHFHHSPGLLRVKKLSGVAR
jgi:hypothetical protein